MEPELLQVIVNGGITYHHLHRPAFILGGGFALVAVSLSLLLIFQHLRSYTNPSEQKWIVVVLFMVPVYATESMILKTLSAFLAFLLELFGVYCDGSFKWYCGYPYIAVVLNFSQMWALYCLVQFYNVTHERLKPIKPLAKFISFKAIVFATWWQGFGISLLCAFGALPNDPKFRTGLQDFLICIEMAVAAMAHSYVFPAEAYHYVPHSKNGKAIIETAKEEVKLSGSGKEEKKEAFVEKTETRVEAAGTSVTESVQDIVVQGGQHVVKDVVLTINQAMGPVEKGVTKIHEKFHRRSTSSGVETEEESEIEVEKH